jgi:anti-sigma-K factor RskA
MNIGKNPELLDKLCASYALGTMSTGARRRLETYAKQSATVRASMLLWRERLSAINELAPSVKPSPRVWDNIRKSLQHELDLNRRLTTSSTLEKTIKKALLRWQAITIAGGLATATALLLGFSQYQQLQASNNQLSAALTAAPTLQYVSVLADDKANANILVTVDEKTGQIAVQRVSEYKEADEKSLQLWSIPKPGIANSIGPTSVTVLDSSQIGRFKVTGGLMNNTSVLAVSLEKKGGVPSADGPQGPVLFKGALLKATM